MKIGVLALQGAFHEHITILKRLGASAVEVRLPEQLADLDGLIIPGGESTTIGKLAVMYDLMEPLQGVGKIFANSPIPQALEMSCKSYIVSRLSFILNSIRNAKRLQSIERCEESKATSFPDAAWITALQPAILVSPIRANLALRAPICLMAKT